MNSTDGTIPMSALNGEEGRVANEQPVDPKKDKTNAAAAAAATGAAAAGVGAAAVYGYQQYTADEPEVVTFDDDDEDLFLEDEIIETEPTTQQPTGYTGGHTAGHTTGGHSTGYTGAGTGAGASTGTATGTGTGAGTGSGSGYTGTGTGTSETPGTGTGTGTGETPGTGTGTGTGGHGVQGVDIPAEEPTEPLDPVVNPQIEVHEDPDEIAEALIAEEQIDPEDYDGTQPFSFTDVETVYDIDGNATTEATFVDENGMTGVMVDLDDDGVFDIVHNDDGHSYTIQNEESFLTVGDAEFDVESGYIAYNEDQDVMIDDDPTDDIIDTESFA